MDANTKEVLMHTVPLVGTWFAGYFAYRVAMKKAEALAQPIITTTKATHDMVNSGLSKLLAAKDELLRVSVEAARKEGRAEVENERLSDHQKS